jgi:hypothetical protein
LASEVFVGEAGRAAGFLVLLLLLIWAGLVVQGRSEEGERL